MGILGGVVVLTVIVVGLWLLTWVTIGIFCGRQWGVNPVLAAALSVCLGFVGLVIVYVVGRRSRSSGARPQASGSTVTSSANEERYGAEIPEF